jgi:hypothetical protein
VVEARRGTSLLGDVRGMYMSAGFSLYEFTLVCTVNLQGHDFLNVAKTRENMANIYLLQGKHNQVLEVYKSVLETKTRVCG